MAKTYSELLRDPRWQKMRLEVMQRDEFKCQHCGAATSTLHVHHKSYIFGNDPWDYPPDNFITLCESCHSSEEENKKQFNDRVACLLQLGYNYDQLLEHLGQLLEPNPNIDF